MTTLIRPTEPIVIRPRLEAYVIRPSNVTQIIPSRISTVRVAPAKAATVKPPDRGAWDERGWVRRHERGLEIFEGQYQVGTRRFTGRIEIGRWRSISAFVHNPPKEIRRHRHRACFQQVGIGTGWFRLHWSRSPRNVDEAILYFEQVLDESLNG